MRPIRIRTKTEEASAVYFPRDALRTLKKYAGDSALIFTDENVFRLYGERMRESLPGAKIHVMPAGEAHKVPETLGGLLQAMAEAELTRASALIAVGGGVVGDLGGLAAALYMRGIRCIQVPTTLLAQVDSSVGGKTAVDFCGVKNLIGAFRQPEAVLVDGAFLQTLPAREILCGAGEIVKYAALDGALFDLLRERREDLCDPAFLSSVVPRCIKFKAEIVRRDPRESGLRRCLNLGHTTGHAIELSHPELSHGACVLYGILYESALAKRYLQCDEEYLSRLEALCKRALSAHAPGIDAAACARLARLDKKNRSAEQIAAVVPVRKGEFALLELAYEEYAHALNQIGEITC